MIKGIIFDLDGTLLDTIEDMTNSVNAVLEDYELKDLSVAEVQQKVGSGFKILMEKALPSHAGEEVVLEATEKFAYYYDKFYMDHSPAYPGMVDLLKELNKQGYKIAVNTNKKESYAKTLIASRFKGVDFIDIVGQREGHPIKPDPYAANLIIEEMGFDKSEVLYVGDSMTDIQTGINAHLSTIGVTWGYRTVEQLKEIGATYIANQASDILDIIKK